MAKIVITIDPKTNKKIFNVDVGDMPFSQAYKLFEQLEKRTFDLQPGGSHSFEEQYCKGLIILADVPHLIEGWLQSELAEDYHFDSNEPQAVFITRQQRFVAQT